MWSFMAVLMLMVPLVFLPPAFLVLNQGWRPARRPRSTSKRPSRHLEGAQAGSPVGCRAA